MFAAVCANQIAKQIHSAILAGTSVALIIKPRAATHAATMSAPARFTRIGYHPG